MWRLYLGVTLAVSGLFAYPLPAGVFMVGDEDGVLWNVDPVSGAAEQVGEMGVVMTDIAFSPWGELYGVSFTDLYRIDPVTAAIIEQVGPVGINGQINALEFDGSGKLYVASMQSWSQGELGMIDLATRQTTVLGSIGYPSDGDLAANPDGTLLMSSYVVSYGLITKITNSRLVRVDPTITTGQLGTSIGLMGFTHTHGMDFVGEELVGTTLAGELISIDTTTGAAALRAVTNPTVRAYGASFTEVLAPAPQGRFESHLPELTEVKNLVLVTHGWNPEGEDRIAWVDVMADMIKARVDPNEWEVVAYQWAEEADTSLPDTALYHGFQQGSLEGRELAGRNYDRVHLIGNSAGAALVDGIAKRLNLDSPDTTIHTTFLDAYASPWIVPWFDGFGASSDWSDHYFNVGDLPPFPLLHKLTETVLDNAHNFNITNLNPLPDDSYFGHQWPRTWYFETIADPSGSQQYGFPLSYEGGNWDPDRYPKGEETVLGQGQPPGLIEWLVQWTGQYLDLQAVTRVVSSMGLVQFFQGGLNMQTDSPVWLIAEVEIENEVNLLRFDLEFTSAAGSEGLLAVYFDDYVVGKIDERFALDGIQQLVFELDDPLPGPHALSLRLDSFSAVPSSVSISSLEWGSVQLVPEPSAFLLIIPAFLSLVVLRLRRFPLKLVCRWSVQLFTQKERHEQV